MKQCGLPCISFDCPYGPDEIIKDGVNGFLVSAFNVREMANRILWMIENNEKRVEMGRAAKNSVARYEKNVVLQKWMMLFDSL